MADRPQPLPAPQFAPRSGPAGRQNLRGIGQPRAGPSPGTRCQILVKRTSVGRTTSPAGDPLNPQDPHRAVERQGNHVADPHRVGGGCHAPAIDPHEASRGKRRGIGARAHHAGMPQPFVDALTVDIFGCSVQDESLPLCSSCCLSAASLAKGEFGSGCRSRPPALPSGLA